MTLVDASEDGVEVRIRIERGGAVQVSVSIAYNFAVAYQQNWLTLELSLAEFSYFVDCLSAGRPSRHGHSTIWSARQIMVKPSQFPTQQSRDITIHRRVLVLGAFWVPCTLSRRLVAAIVEALPAVEQVLATPSAG